MNLTQEERHFIRDGVYVLSTTPRVLPAGPLITLPIELDTLLTQLGGVALGDDWSTMQARASDLRELYKLLGVSGAAWVQPAWANMLQQLGQTVPQPSETFAYVVSLAGSPPPPISAPVASVPAPAATPPAAPAAQPEPPAPPAAPEQPAAPASPPAPTAGVPSTVQIAQAIKSALELLGIFTDETGRIGIGGPPVRDPRDNAPLLNYPLTIHGKIGAGVAYIANESLSDPQRGGNNDPQRVHVGTDGVSQDGGRRRGMGALYRDTPLPDGSWDAFIPDEFRPIWNNGPDSRAQECWQEKPVVADSRFEGKSARQAGGEVVNGQRVKSGQDLYLHLKATDPATGEEEVQFIAGKKEITIRGSDSVWYDGGEPAKL